MAHCMICRKDFASSASLRTHRSRYHRISDTEMVPVENQETEQMNSLDTNQTSSQETNQTDSQETTNSQEATDSQSSLQTNDDKDRAHLQDTFSSKRRHVESQSTDDEADPNPPKDRHVYKKLSGIHEILKNHLEGNKPTVDFISCYSIKAMFDSLVPDVFVSELAMKEKLNHNQFVYATIIRELQNLLDIHTVLNEAKNRDIWKDIYKIALKERETTVT